jgi:hypothetical protein
VVRLACHRRNVIASRKTHTGPDGKIRGSNDPPSKCCNPSVDMARFDGVDGALLAFLADTTICLLITPLLVLQLFHCTLWYSECTWILRFPVMLKEMQRLKDKADVAHIMKRDLKS